MKTIAVMMCVLLPAGALAQQQATLTPTFEQSTPALEVKSAAVEATPLYRRWWVWAGTGTAVATAVAVVVAVVVSTHRDPPTHQPMKSSFPCDTACDGWINAPAQ